VIGNHNVILVHCRPGNAVGIKGASNNVTVKVFPHYRRDPTALVKRPSVIISGPDSAVAILDGTVADVRLFLQGGAILCDTVPCAHRTAYKRLYECVTGVWIDEPVSKKARTDYQLIVDAADAMLLLSSVALIACIMDLTKIENSCTWVPIISYHFSMFHISIIVLVERSWQTSSPRQPSQFIPC
jgi:hypothetical protein